MQIEIEELRKLFYAELQDATDTSSLDVLKVKYLGRKGPVQALMPRLKECTPEERPIVGQLINKLKQEIQHHLEETLLRSKKADSTKRLATETIDITLPGSSSNTGRKHLVSQMIEEVADIHMQMGFSVQTSPEIESEFYNYGGLNYPDDHPARDMQDTYYLTPDILLRSHTTSFQQRIMEAHTPPIRVVNIGKCYRNETISTRSHVLFHQFDGMYIDKNVTLADLIATQKELYSRIFHQDVKIRVRNSYFPFVEPGMEVDIFCLSCEGSGCRLCKNTGWLEVCGAGLIHPEILREGGLDPEEYSGYAWGGGIERLILLRHGVGDIRLFMENNLSFLQQF
jgi:phenylalanyl-tRNA synthetase alpha chain